MGFQRAAASPVSGPAHKRMQACQLCSPHEESLRQGCWHGWHVAMGAAGACAVVAAGAAAPEASQLWTVGCRWGMPGAHAPAAPGPPALPSPAVELVAAKTTHLHTKSPCIGCCFEDQCGLSKPQPQGNIGKEEATRMPPATLPDYNVIKEECSGRGQKLGCPEVPPWPKGPMCIDLSRSERTFRSDRVKQQ